MVASADVAVAVAVVVAVVVAATAATAACLRLLHVTYRSSVQKGVLRKKTFVLLALVERGIST